MHNNSFNAKPIDTNSKMNKGENLIYTKSQMYSFSKSTRSTDVSGKLNHTNLDFIDMSKAKSFVFRRTQQHVPYTKSNRNQSNHIILGRSDLSVFSRFMNVSGLDEKTSGLISQATIFGVKAMCPDVLG